MSTMHSTSATTVMKRPKGGQDFLSPEVLRGIDIPVMDEATIEDFESWNDNETTVSSTTASATASANEKHCMYLPLTYAQMLGSKPSPWLTARKLISSMYYHTQTVIHYRRPALST